MYIVGIDENGFGPKLGPLVITGTLFKIDREYSQYIFKKDDLEKRVKDSKDIFKQSIRSKAKAEDIVLSYYYLLFKKYPRDANEFLKDINLDSCFPHDICHNIYRKICWQPELSIPIWKDTPLNYCSEWKTDLKEIKSIICCPGEYNRSLKSKPNKMLLNLSCFEKLIKYFRESNEGKILFLCGKIGGIKDYLSYSNFLKDQHQCQTSKISNDISIYNSSSLGTISFIKDGDQSEFSISLASIFGKYIREIFMERLNRNFSEEIKNNRYISGYYNRITDTFIENVLAKRYQLGIPNDYITNCFIRNK